MARLTSVRQIWTFIFGTLGALVALMVGPGLALHQLGTHEHQATSIAVLWVAAGTLSLVPMILLMVWLYRRSDEYERQGLLLTFAIGLAVAFLGMAALDLLQHTDLLGWWVWSPRWWTVAVSWLVGIVIVRGVMRRTV